MTTKTCNDFPNETHITVAVMTFGQSEAELAKTLAAHFNETFANTVRMAAGSEIGDGVEFTSEIVLFGANTTVWMHFPKVQGGMNNTNAEICAVVARSFIAGWGHRGTADQKEN